MYSIIVKKKDSESSSVLFRNFTKRMQVSGIMQKFKKEIYNSRPQSKNTIKNQKIRKLVKEDEFKKLFRLGKIQNKSFRKKR